MSTWRGAKAAQVLHEARKLAGRVESWAHFSNALFDPGDGIVAKVFPSAEERRAFLKSPEYREVDRLLAGLMQRFGVADGATPKKSGKFVIRLPKTLHFALEREATQEGVSLNQLVVAKLAISLFAIGGGEDPRPTWASPIITTSRLFRRRRCEKVALRAALILAQSAKKRGQLSAITAPAWNISWNINNLLSMFFA
jgi:hypothetical protein